MGLDYAYRLYFPRPRVPEALLGLAAMCVPGKVMGKIRFPEGIREVPFEPFPVDYIPNWDDRHYSFDVILNLEADEALERFTRMDPETLHAQGDRLNLGYIYFSVGNEAESDVSCFSFIAGGNRMSWAFMDSYALRRLFRHLLAAHEGICGFLDMDVMQDVFWWRGEETWERLYDAWTLEEIDRQMRQRRRPTGRGRRSRRRET